MIVAEASYESTDPTVDSQIATLKGSGADTLFSFASPKFAAQAIRKAYDIGWKPLHFVVYIVDLRQGGAAARRPGEIGRRHFLDVRQGSHRSALEERSRRRRNGCVDAEVLSGRRPAEIYNVYGYTNAQLLVHVLKRCGDDLTRENVMRQAASLRDLELPMLLPGIRINTSATDYDPIEQLQLMRFDGTEWVRFGEIVGR